MRITCLLPLRSWIGFFANWRGPQAKDNTKTAQEAHPKALSSPEPSPRLLLNVPRCERTADESGRMGLKRNSRVHSGRSAPRVEASSRTVPEAVRVRCPHSDHHSTTSSPSQRHRQSRAASRWKPLAEAQSGIPGAALDRLHGSARGGTLATGQTLPFRAERSAASCPGPTQDRIPRAAPVSPSDPDQRIDLDICMGTTA